MQVSVFYLPSIGSRSEIEKGMAGLRGDLYQQMLSELKEQAQLDVWLRDGSAAYVDSLCVWPDA